MPFHLYLLSWEEGHSDAFLPALGADLPRCRDAGQGSRTRQCGFGVMPMCETGKDDPNDSITSVQAFCEGYLPWVIFVFPSPLPPASSAY